MTFVYIRLAFRIYRRRRRCDRPQTICFACSKMIVELLCKPNVKLPHLSGFLTCSPSRCTLFGGGLKSFRRTSLAHGAYVLAVCIDFCQLLRRSNRTLTTLTTHLAIVCRLVAEWQTNSFGWMRCSGQSAWLHA